MPEKVVQHGGFHGEHGSHQVMKLQTAVEKNQRSQLDANPHSAHRIKLQPVPKDIPPAFVVGDRVHERGSSR